MKAKDFTYLRHVYGGGDQVTLSKNTDKKNYLLLVECYWKPGKHPFSISREYAKLSDGLAVYRFLQTCNPLSIRHFVMGKNVTL